MHEVLGIDEGEVYGIMDMNVGEVFVEDVQGIDEGQDVGETGSSELGSKKSIKGDKE